MLDDTVLKMGGKFFEIRKFLKCAHVHVAREGVVMFKRMWGGGGWVGVGDDTISQRDTI